MNFTLENAHGFVKDLAAWARLTGLWDAARRIFYESDWSKLGKSFEELLPA